MISRPDSHPERAPRDEGSSLLIVISLLFSGLFSTGIHADPGDDLIIIDKVVNLREQPSTDAKVLLKLGQDRRLVEIQRQGEWVEVYTDRDDIGSGWVHATLIAPLPDQDTPLINHTRSYDRFIEKFKQISANWQQQHGGPPFTRVDEYINFRIKLIATEAWLQTPQTERDEMLKNLFDLWSQSAGDEQSIEIVILLPDGTPTMSMFR